ACVAGVFDLDEALELVCARARMMARLPEGGVMLAVAAARDQVAEVVARNADTVALAAVNAPGSVVVSGPTSDLAAIRDVLAGRRIASQPLRVSHAFHSPLMRPSLAEFAQAAKAVTYRAPRVPLVSNVTGARFVSGEVPDADYWVRQASATVEFERGVRAAHESGCTIFLEVG